MTLQDLIQIATDEGLDPASVRLLTTIGGTVFELDTVDGGEVTALGLDVDRNLLFTFTPETPFSAVDSASLEHAAARLDLEATKHRGMASGDDALADANERASAAIRSLWKRA